MFVRDRLRNGAGIYTPIKRAGIFTDRGDQFACEHKRIRERRRTERRQIARGFRLVFGADALFADAAGGTGARIHKNRNVGLGGKFEAL